MRVARSAHCFAPNRCTISAASRSSRFGLPVDAVSDDLCLGGGGHAQSAPLCRCQAVAQIECAAQPRKVGLQRLDMPAELIG